jgi:hypothetical protein
MEHLWPRAIALGVAVVVAALLLKVAPPLVVLAVFVAGFTVFYVRLKRSVRPAAIADAGVTGLERAEVDPFGILGYPLLLLSRVLEPAIDEVVWGRWRGVDVHAFTLSFDPPAGIEAVLGRTVFSCAMARILPAAPAVVVEPQLFATSVAAAPDLGRVELDDVAFQGAARVWAEDGAFARALLGPGTREWLRSVEPGLGLEVRGHIALVYGPKADRDVTQILEGLRGLLARLPKDEDVPHPPAV